MLKAYTIMGRGLGPADRIEDALWIDLVRPNDEEVRSLAELGLDVPSLADMEEIEISNRLYREDEIETLTVVLPGLTDDGAQIAAPVSFILTPARLVTVRHHTPRPFETFPTRAGQSSAGCATPVELFLGLAEEVVARQADLLEAAGRVLDACGREVFSEDVPRAATTLQATLCKVGQQGELIGRVRLALLTMERAVGFLDMRNRAASVRGLSDGLLRYIEALSVHCDYLSSRLGLTVDATLGLISLVQNATVRIFSVVAVLFLPPTLVASIYGMNFTLMPELDQPWGYPAALLLMLASALGCYLVFKWKKWL